VRHRRMAPLFLGISAAGIAIWLAMSFFGYWPFGFGDLSGVTWYAIAAPENAGLEGVPWHWHDLALDHERLNVERMTTLAFASTGKSRFALIWDREVVGRD
jgi:hypothetical protein